MEDEQLGMLHLVTPDKRPQAAALAREELTVDWARPLVSAAAADVAIPPLHCMMESGESHCLPSADEWGPRQMSADFIGMGFHGLATTYIDDLRYIFWDGKIYNGRSADLVTTSRGTGIPE